MKTVKAVAPYIHPGFLNFKTAPYEAWVKNVNENDNGNENVNDNLNENENSAGKREQSDACISFAEREQIRAKLNESEKGVAKVHYPWRIFHGLAYRWELPTFWKSKKEARLRFVEPVSLSFDAFPDYARYEIIPFVWDCWPQYFEKMCRWMEKHQVRTAIFTSSQTAERMQERFPKMNIMFCPEAVDCSKYIPGKPLRERTIDVLEFGRNVNLNLNENANLNDNDNRGGYNYICTKVDGKFMFTNEQLVEAMGDAKVTIALPRSVTDPDMAGDIETLTQRYWECMLSRIVMVGHAPKELTELIGYNPVIEINVNARSATEGDACVEKRSKNEKKDILRQIKGVLEHIEDYQELVDKNRETALRLGDWNVRMKQVMVWLRKQGYDI